MKTHELTGQQQVIVDYLKKGRTLSNKVALTCLGVGSLSSRISELRRLGYGIETEHEEDKLTGRLFKKYNLAAPSGCPHCGYRHPPDGVCV